MKPYRHTLAMALAALIALTLCTSKAHAGRLGGGVFESVTVPAHGSVTFDIPFVAGEPAVVAIGGNGATFLEMVISDGDNHIWRGKGSGDRKASIFNVYRTGFFRIEVRNLSPRPSTCVLSTN